MMQSDDESQTLNQGVEIGKVNARAFSTTTQVSPPITFESFSMSPFDHVRVDGETNDSSERGVGHPFVNGFVATIDSYIISINCEIDLHKDNITEKTMTSPLKIELTYYTSGNVDAKLYDHNLNVTNLIFQGTFRASS
ncbi:hypothetical protein V6N13_065483 [Hibiscus sabdariffa]